MDKEFKKVLRNAERQGWRVHLVKKGIMLYPPDKHREIVTIHKTPSDRRAFDNFLTQMRRSGYKG